MDILNPQSGRSGFYPYQVPGKKHLPTVILIILTLFVLAVLFVAILLVSYYKNSQDRSYFEYDPYDAKNVSTWVAPSLNKTALVDVSVATEYHSLPSISGQKYIVPEQNINTVFTTEGYYKGDKFRYMAFEEGVAVMRITPELIPYDNVLDVYAFERFEGDTLRAYFFFDQDWKDRYGDATYIISGRNFNESRKAVFNEARAGIYYDVVEDDITRFGDGIGGASVYGGVIAGTFDSQQLINTPPQQLIAIMIS